MSRLSLSLALIGGLWSFQDPAPPAAKLEVRAPAAGDRTEVKIESTFELDVETKSNQDEPGVKSVRQLSYVRTVECSQVVQSAQEGQVPTFRITVNAAKLQKSGTNMAPATEASEMESKSFVVTRTDKGRVVKAENGDPAPADAAGLGAWEDFGSLLPKGEPKEGESWKVDAAAVAALISIPDLPVAAGTFDAKVESLADNKLVVFFTGAIEGKTAKGFDMKLTVKEGRLTFDVAKSRPASLAIVGELVGMKEIHQKVSRQRELRQIEEKVGEVRVTSRKLEVKVEFK
jgi:hypothetical protein